MWDKPPSIMMNYFTSDTMLTCPLCRFFWTTERCFLALQIEKLKLQNSLFWGVGVWERVFVCQ